MRRAVRQEIKAGADLIKLGYLEDEMVSDVPFRRVAAKFPDNFKKVFEYYRDDIGYYAESVDDLMQVFTLDTELNVIDFPL